MTMRNGKSPEDWEVHHKSPLDDGGINEFSNLVLIPKTPYHKALTNYQNKVTRGFKIGEAHEIMWPVIEGKVYTGKS